MLVECDATGLEWVTVAWLSHDEVAITEISNQVDQHEENRARFNLPERVIAKKFVFRLIYGGSAYSYAHDPDFIKTSNQEKFWQKVIDQFYEKYYGIERWHNQILTETKSTGLLRIPTGRVYTFSPQERRGDLVWPRTQILNYPVQGAAADIMVIVRVAFARRFIEEKIRGKLVSTVHDSIVVDVEDDEVERTCLLFTEVFKETRQLVNNYFQTDFPVDLRCEIKYGRDLFNVKKWKHA